MTLCTRFILKSLQLLDYKNTFSCIERSEKFTLMTAKLRLDRFYYSVFSLSLFGLLCSFCKRLVNRFLYSHVSSRSALTVSFSKKTNLYSLCPWVQREHVHCQSTRATIWKWPSREFNAVHAMYFGFTRVQWYHDFRWNFENCCATNNLSNVHLISDRGQLIHTISLFIAPFSIYNPKLSSVLAATKTGEPQETVLCQIRP